MLLTCQSGFEPLLARELVELHRGNVSEKGPGWVRTDSWAHGADLFRTPGAGARVAGEPALLAAANPPGPATPPPPTAAVPLGVPADSLLPRLAFPHLSLIETVELQGQSVNALANQIAAHFMTALRGERVDAPWPSLWFGPHELVGLGRRIGAVETAFGEQLKKRLARIARLATPELPRGIGPVRGLFVFFVDFGRVLVAREAFIHGPRRMADDPLAPSRSYLKVEEAYVVLGREPSPAETVCDLGAAPGGWSFSAAKRGAHVVAIDNGPLKGGALDHPNIEHRREDAFKFAPPPGQPFDWLFCDMVEEPHHVLRDIVAPWVSRRWCRRLVVNLKFGRVDPVALLRELDGAGSPLGGLAGLRIRHLYHDREEFTVVGEVS